MLDVNNRKASVNPADSFAVAVNTRLAIHAGGDYLLVKLDTNPAAPNELANSVKELAVTYQNIVLDQIGDTAQPELDAAYQTAEQLGTDTRQTCR